MTRARRLSLTPGAAASGFVALALAATYAWEQTGRQVTDFALYRAYGEAIVGGAVPYRDLALEYPPLALPAFALPALVSGGDTSYMVTFALLMAACGAVAVVLTSRALEALGRTAAARARILALLALSPLALGPVLLTRFDLVPSLAVAAATLASLRGRERMAAGLLGLGIAAKLWPGALLPLLAIAAWRRRGGRDAVIVVGVAIGVAVTAYLPFLVVAPDGVVDSIGRQLGRPLQIESLGSGILLALHHVTGMPLGWSSGSGSQNLTGVAAGMLAVALGIAQAGVVAAVTVSFARGPASGERLVRHAAGVVAGLVAFGRVLSPQFLVWPLFAVALVGGVRGRRAGALYAAACLLTLGWFPAWYWDLVREFDPVASAFVLARDVALVALFAVLVWPRRARASRSAPG